jgi:hypothetical protein
MSDEVEFVVAEGGKVVHVFRRQVDALAIKIMEDNGEKIDDNLRASMNLMRGRVQARCGTVFVWHFNMHVGVFNDDALCRRCHKATPVEEQHLLFEHETLHEEEVG